MNNIRTRIAPSPTGFMHIGNLRTAIFNYLLAKNKNGSFILRIEDTDQARKVDGAIEFIYNTLNLCHLEIDEGPNNPSEYGPYIQSDRLEIYKKYAEDLVKSGHAYYCFCKEDRLEDLRKAASDNNQTFMYDGKCLELTKEEIDNKLANNEPYVIRQKMPNTGITTYNDVVYGEIKVENKILEDQILLKSDGYPTYNFANVIDDHLMKITHVARGNEYLMSTAKYNLLYDAFSWEKPIYIHLPMVLGEDGQKLSKRNGDASFMDLYDEGYLPDAIVNYLALLGWSSPNNEEIFSMEELIKIFDIKRISKSPSTYDVMKLRWVNSHYLKQLNKEEFVNFVKPFLESAYDLSNKNNIDEVICLYQDELKYGKEIIELTKIFFEDNYELNDECKEFMLQIGVDDTIKIFKEEIEKLNTWKIEDINTCINNTKEKANVKGKMLYMPIRIQVSGIMHGPELDKTIYLLGKDKILERLNNHIF